jgi:hypothetical protein
MILIRRMIDRRIHPAGASRPSSFGVLTPVSAGAGVKIPTKEFRDGPPDESGG